ncbi:MAG: DUF4837 family protein [Candidatus Neomarinimicrobiota bacterium]|nr:DUF4837 family protein [Candidatus Neomarinimicrobiota bacterium]
MIFGCAGKKDSLGTDDEIRVICSKIDEPVIKDYLAYVFDDTIYTPAPEPLFKLIFSRPEHYDDLKEYAQVIIAAVNRNSTNPGYRLLKKLLPEGQLNNSEDDNPVLLTRDLHAKDQVYVVINASNKEHLFNYLDKNKVLLRKHYDEQFKLRGSRFLFNDNQTQIEEKINEDYGWFLKIPWGWEVLRNDDKMNFFWMGSEYPYRWMSIKWDNGNNINDGLSLGKQIWNFPINHYKSIRFNENRFKLDRIYFNDYKGWQCSGIWESMDSLDAKGGPFYSYIFYDHHSDRTFHINTLVHNPGKSKAVYIRQMELIAKSFRSIVREKI